MFLLPIGVFSGVFVMGGSFIGAVVGTSIFLFRPGSLRQLGRFAIAVYGLTIVVGFPINVLLRGINGHGSLLAVRAAPLAVMASLLLLGVIYTGGYYLIYKGGYQRLKRRYREFVFKNTSG